HRERTSTSVCRPGGHTQRWSHEESFLSSEQPPPKASPANSVNCQESAPAQKASGPLAWRIRSTPGTKLLVRLRRLAIPQVLPRAQPCDLSRAAVERISPDCQPLSLPSQVRDIGAQCIPAG